jgi:4-diphosphocytidyl-2-C-methyl-D-erythritol kinase
MQALPIQSVCVDAPAKINLFLHVIGRRDDGYHLLESLVAFTEFGDFIKVEAADGLTFSVEGPFAAALSGALDDNLVLRSAVALREVGNVALGARIILEKNLPISSGVGGGSADAAAALRALATLWDIGLTDQRLANLGLSIGADIPVCLNARPSMMGGIGECIVDINILPSCAVVLVNAREAVSTTAVFGERTGEFTKPKGWTPPKDFDDMINALAKRRNDLLAPAIVVSPVIGDVLAGLAQSPHCAFVGLSGSGGTGFGLFMDGSHAKDAAQRITSEHPDWWCRATALRAFPPSVQTTP